MSIATFTGFLGANTKVEPRSLQPAVGVSSVNQKPGERGDFRPWRVPLAVSPAPNTPTGRQTLYRMGRDTQSTSAFWLSWTAVVHAIRGFDANDTTERTYYTGDGAPKWTDNIIGLAGEPYPTTARLLAVPQPTIAPVVTLNADGPSGDARALYYCFTWVNDIGWEGPPSPPTLAPLARPGAVLDLSTTEAVPAGNYGVNRVRWYRTQTTGTQGDAEFFFVAEYLLAASPQQDVGAELGTDVLPTQPDTLRLPLATTAKFLTQVTNQFAAAIVGKTVRFSEPELIYSWPEGNAYAVNDTPVALASFAGRTLALTTGVSELFTGSEPDQMDQRQLQLSPIVSPRSLVVGETWCAWAAADGFWYYGTDGYRNLVGDAMTVEQWRALAPTTMHCHYAQIGDRPIIVCFYNDGALKGVVIDPSNPAGVYYLSQGYEAAYWDKLQRKLFVLDAGVLKEWDAGSTYMTATARSKVFRQEQHAEAEWIEMVGSGTVTARVLTNDMTNPNSDAPLIERMNRTITTGQNRLPDGTGGRDWQIEISTQGSVQGVAVD